MFSVVSITALSDCEYEKAYSVMSPARKAKVDRLKIPNDKKRSLAGEWLIRTMLSENFSIPFEESRIEIDPLGKPYLENLPYHFSISHSGDMVVCAISKDRIGIDIEEIHPIDFRLTECFCLDEEKKYIFSSPEGKIERFYEIWTIKEAYFKMLGTGITDFFKVNALSDRIKKERISLEGYMVHIVTE